MARVLLVAAAAAVLAGCASTGEPVQGSGTEVREIGPENLTQTFVPAGERLSRLTVWSATYGVEPPDAVVRLDLSGAGQERTALVGRADLGDNRRITFVFPPVVGAAGKRFSARFSAEGTDAVGLYANPHDPYPDGALEPPPGDLAFEVGHAGRLSGTLAALERVGREARARLARDPAFTAVWAAALAALGAGALWAWWRRPGRRHR